MAMFGIHLLCCILSIGTALSALAPPVTQRLQQSKLQPFIDSLALPPPQARSLSNRLDQDQNLAAFLSGKDYQSSGLQALACLSLGLILGENLVDTLPVNQTETEANWSQSCWRSPICAVLPASAQDVSRTLKTIKFFKSRFAIRSGGHSPNPGFSNINNPGILIDLQRLNQIEISADKKVASLGPGGRWDDVLAALDPHDVSVIGGRIPQVGVAGVILGEQLTVSIRGGLFHFSGEYGLAGDNVKNFEIVLSDGTVTNANADRNVDLFWALKGGGANFGIVTRFDLYTIPVKNIWFQVAIYAPDQVPAILDALARWQDRGASDVKSTVALIIGLEATTVGLIYSAPADKPEAFDPFYSIPPATVAVPAANGTVLGLTNILGTTFSQVPQRHDYRGASSKVDVQLYKDVHSFWRERAVAVHEATGANMTFTLQPIPVNLVDQGIAKGGNPLGLPRINHQWWTTLVDWTNAEDDDKVRAVPIATSEKWKELGEQRGSYIPFLFMNDASRDQSPLSLYGAENLARLKKISKLYDPSQMFQTLQGNGFLLSKVPNCLLFNTPKAFRAIYGSKANVKKGRFYATYPQKAGIFNTWESDHAEHARKRRILNAAFSDKALRTYEPFMIQHVDRWCELLLDGARYEWSSPKDMADWSDYLIFDILGELCYAKSFGLKESGNNDLRSIPKFMAAFNTVLHNIARSPWQGLWLWLKPRGLDRLMEIFAPKNYLAYVRFIRSNLSSRIAQEQNGGEKISDPADVRKDIFHYLIHAKDPETGGPGYTMEELRAETSLLVVAGSDTTSTVIPAMFFYMTRNPKMHDTLVKEIRTTFKNGSEICAGPKLTSCRYLRAFIDETMRINPPAGTDPIREVLAGGITVEGKFLPEGTDVGVSIYALHHNEATFPDSFKFQPQRWIADEHTDVAPAHAAASGSGFAPFSIGPRGCPGKNLAYLEMSITMAKVLYLCDVQAVEGNDLGGGKPDQIWGRQNKEQYQTWDVNDYRSMKISPNEADATANIPAQTPRRGILKSSNEHPLAWTERVARSRPRAPVRRLSASEEAGSRRIHAPLPLAVTDKALDADNRRRDVKELGTFGLPTQIIPHARASDSIDLSNELANSPFCQKLPDSYDGEVNMNYHDHSMSPSRYQGSPRVDRHQRTVSFADEQDEVNMSDTKQSGIPLGNQLEQAFTLHALYQSEGGVLRNRFAATTAAKDALTQQTKTKLKLFQRPRTLILGHKAGLWLTNYAFDSFCQVANTLILHQWDDVGGYPKDYSKVKDREKLDISVDIKDGDKKIKRIVIKALTEAGKKQYEKIIMRILQKQEPKPLIRVHDGKLKCNFDCKRVPTDNEPSCDNSRDLEVEVPDVGFLRVLADWHRWREQPKLVENSGVFENAVFRLLFPTTTDKNEFTIELPDGVTFRVTRNAHPALPADVQKALSHITTAESQEGVAPAKIKLRPYKSAPQLILERPPESPSQKSPGLARAEGTIFVHRPANFTHFRYELPQTMERFFKLARRELYPDTQGRLRLRISPSNTFRQEGKLLLPVVERKGSYRDRDEDGETPEDVWKDSIVDKWLTPLEDVWIIKVFDTIKVFDGLWDENVPYEPEHWDVSALQDRASHNSEDAGWNIPPESLMDDLAKISMKFLDVDPRKSRRGIVLHVKRETPGEWLRWKSPMTFLEFMLEVLYKIDGEAIAIYPGDYVGFMFAYPTSHVNIVQEEPDEGIDVELEQIRAVEAMAQMKRKKTLAARNAVEAFAKPVLLRNPAQADGRFDNLGHLGIQLPQTTWDPEGTHLGPAPSYASNALIYSATDMGLLQQRLFRAENEILMREEACRDRITEISDHYRSHVMTGPRACPSKGCDENLNNRDEFLTWAQLIDHLMLHPETSDVRNEVQKAPPKVRRESATQTNADDLDLRYRYRLNSKDSLLELPTGDAKLWCSKCYQYIHELNEKELEDHAKQCRTTVRDFAPLEVRKTFDRGTQITTLKSRHKPTTSRARPRGKSTTVETATLGTETVNDSASTAVSGRGKRKAATSKIPAKVVPTAPSMGTAADSNTLNDSEAAKEAKFASMVQKARAAKASTTGQSRPRRSRSVPLASGNTSEAPTPAQLRTSQRGNTLAQGQQQQDAQENPQSRQKGLSGSLRTTRSTANAKGAIEQAVIAPSSKQESKALVKKNETATEEANNNLPLARSKRKTRETEADLKSGDPEVGADEPPPPKRRRTKIAQGYEKATERAAGDSTAQEPPATAVSVVPGPPPGELKRKRAPKAKAEDIKIPDDPDTPERPTRPIRKPRARKAKVGHAPAPQDPTALTAGSQPDPPKRARAARAKKTDTQPGATDPAQIPTEAGKEGTALTTSPRKRKAPVSKTTTNTSPAKKRKLSPLEEETESQPTAATKVADAAPSLETPTHASDFAGADDRNPARLPAKGKGKGTVEVLSTEPTTTSSRKLKTLAPKTKTEASPAKKRKTAPTEEETETLLRAPAENDVDISLEASGQEEANTGADEDIQGESETKGKGKAIVTEPASRSPTPSPKKRRILAPKTTTKAPLGKKRKTAPTEEDTETQPGTNTGNEVTGPTVPIAETGADEDVQEENLATTNGKGKPKIEATKSTTTTFTKRKTPASQITAATASPAKKRKVAPEEERIAGISTTEGVVVPSVELAVSAARIEGEAGAGLGGADAGEEHRGKRKRKGTSDAEGSGGG
ncbi:MAG: hypothetical protein Q9213_007662 [Squamulea squamosa]